MGVIAKPTTNFSQRPTGVKVDCIVLHADASASEAGTISWIANPTSQVSYHYLVGRDGTVYQFVSDSLRAWHAGKSIFQGKADCNDFSLGVSFANDQKGEPFPVAQIDAGVALVAALCGRHGITVGRITTHEVVRDAARAWAQRQGLPLPDKKTDPGPKFPLTAFLQRVGAVLP